MALTKFTTVKLGQPIRCYGQKFAIKDFYVKTVNNENLKTGYNITLGGGQFGYHVAGKTKSVMYDDNTNLYKLLFYKK
jgi:hypothetical protein